MCLYGGGGVCKRKLQVMTMISNHVHRVYMVRTDLYIWYVSSWLLSVDR